MLFTCAHAAHACTLDDVDAAISRDTLNHYFPDALDVLARVVEARRANGLPPSPGLTPTPLHIRGLMGLAERLDKHWRAAAGDASRPAVALLLVEAMLWTRLPAQPSAAVPDLHAKGPMEGDVVVVISEETARQLVAGKLSLLTAKSSGLARIYGPDLEQNRFMATLGSAGRTSEPR